MNRFEKPDFTSRHRLALFVLGATALAAVVCAPSAHAADWPAWRYDAGRTAASPEALPDTLHVRWMRQYTQREPVWEDPLNRDLMPYDTVFEPIVHQGMVFLTFNDKDKVVALDIATGEERWSFYCDGPLRLPPTAYDGKLYVPSDDGHLYCLDAGAGALRWRFRGGPGERKALGNSRLINTWPVRSGPVVADGRVYGGASIWPFMGVFIYALDAETGAIVWMNDGESARFQQQPHGGAYSFASVAPQGAFALCGDALLVPGGRSVPAVFDRATGAFRYYQFAKYSKTGGSFVCAIDDVFFSHHREQVTNLYAMGDGSLLADRMGEHPVLTSAVYYMSGPTVRAFDAEAIRAKPAEWPQALLWEFPVEARGDLIKAGDRLYAAGDGHITAIALPDGAGTEPSLAWTRRMDGEVGRLLAADQTLIAVTLDGCVIALGPENGAPSEFLHRAITPVPSESAAQKAQTLLDTTDVREGYALFHGIGDGELLEALAVLSDLHIVATERDPERIEQFRRRYDESSLYGTRIAIVPGDPLTAELPAYMASLTVVNDLDAKDFPRDKALLTRLFHSMRPYGGKLVFADTEQNRAITAACDPAAFPGIENLSDAGHIVLSRSGPLPGAGTWTGNLGNIGQTAKSDDQLVRLPLGLLWFGGSPNTDVLPRHGHGPPQQVIGGRLFIQGIDSMSARDVYTGRVIWKTPMHDLGTFGTYYDGTYKETPTDTRYNQVHIPGANVRGTNFVATEDELYVIQGSETHVLSTLTGARLRALRLPPIDPDAERKRYPEWAYIGVYEDLLIGGAGFVAFSDLAPMPKQDYSVWEDLDTSASKKLVAMDRHSGKLLWEVESESGFLHNGIAAGNGRLFCLDRIPPNIQKRLERRGETAPAGFRITALDIRTGEVVWQRQEDVFGTFLSYSSEHDALVHSGRPSRDMVRDEPNDRMMALQGRDGAVIWDKAVSYQTFPIIHGDAIITEYAMFGLLDGEPRFREDPVTGVQTPWKWVRTYGCNYPIASEHLLTFRSGAAGFFDLENDGGTGNIGGFKSGCTNNLIVADGVLNAPDYTRTCSCAYQNQTSLALVHMPEIEFWTLNLVEQTDAPIRRIGINLGAPGDRRDGETLWVEYPSVGGASPDPEITASGDGLDWFLHHSSRVAGGDGPAWVAASGARGLSRFTIGLAAADTPARVYTIRLHFAETDSLKPGDRVFDVDLQGARVLEKFDVVAEAGGPMRGIVREFSGVRVEDTLTLAFEAASAAPPVLSGIEIVQEGPVASE